MYAQAGPSLCWPHLSHFWKSHALAQLRWLKDTCMEILFFVFLVLITNAAVFFSEDDIYESDMEFQEDHLLQMLRKQRAQYELQLRYV